MPKREQADVPSRLGSINHRSLPHRHRLGLAACAIDTMVGKITGRYYHRTGQFVFLFPVDELSSAKSIGNQRCLAVETLHEIMNSFQLELLETLFN